MFGVQPDIVCLAKALGGGVPCGAIGGTAEVMEMVVDGSYQQVGTFNGNPLTMAAARAMLTEVLTPDAYAHFDLLGERMRTRRAAARCAEPTCRPTCGGSGPRGAIVFHPTPVRDYREFLAVHGELSHAHWLVQHNSGVFLPPWGKAEQWTLSVQHTTADVDRFVANVSTFAETLAHLDRWVSAEAVALND